MGGAGGALVLGEAVTPTPIGRGRALALVEGLDATNDAMDISGAQTRPALPPPQPRNPRGRTPTCRATETTGGFGGAALLPPTVSLANPSCG